MLETVEEEVDEVMMEDGNEGQEQVTPDKDLLPITFCVVNKVQGQEFRRPLMC